MKISSVSILISTKVNVHLYGVVFALLVSYQRLAALFARRS